MAMDIKLNVFQFTPKQLEKRIAKYDMHVKILAKIEEEKQKKLAQKVETEQKAAKQAEEMTEEEKEQQFFQDAMYLGRRPGKYKMQNGKMVRNRVGEKKQKQQRWF
jgi:asparagine synthetase B (glutamine-hydrolysing)